MARLTLFGGSRTNTRRAASVNTNTVRRRTFITHIRAGAEELVAAAKRGTMRQRLDSGDFPIILPVLLGATDDESMAVTDLHRLPHLILTGGSEPVRCQALANAMMVAAHALKDGRDRITVLSPAGSPLLRMRNYTAEYRLRVEFHAGRDAVLRVLSDLADRVESYDTPGGMANGVTILEPVGRYHWGTPLARIPQAGGILHNTTERVSPVIIRRGQQDVTRTMVIIDAAAGLLWLGDESLRRTFNRLLMRGPSAGVHMLISSSLLQVPPLGHFVDKDLGGHWFYSATAAHGPVGLFIGPGLVNAERVRHVKLTPPGDPGESGRAHISDAAVPVKNDIRRDTPEESGIEGSIDPAPESVRRLLSRDAFTAPAITGIHDRRQVDFGDIAEELHQRGLIVRDMDGRFIPRVDAEHYYRSVSAWLAD